MTFALERGKFYRMPAPYGPMPGPRPIPAGKPVYHRHNPKRRTLHYKFMPRTGDWGAADCAGAVLSPSHPSDVTVTSRKTGEGHFHFRRSQWEDLPTLYHIVNTLAEIELLEFRGANLTLSEGSTDHANQRVMGGDAFARDGVDATLLSAKLETIIQQKV